MGQVNFYNSLELASKLFDLKEVDEGSAMRIRPRC